MKTKLLVFVLVFASCVFKTATAQVVTVITMFNGLNAQRASIDDYMMYTNKQAESDAAKNALRTFIRSSENLYYSSISFGEETIVLCTYSERPIPAPSTYDHILYKFFISHRVYRPGDEGYEHLKSAALERSVYHH